MLRPDQYSLKELALGRPSSSRRFIADRTGTIYFTALQEKSRQPSTQNVLFNRSVLISCDRQLPAAQALLALDGVARRIVLCPSDLPGAYLPAILADAEVDLIVSDGTGPVIQGVSGISTILPDECLFSQAHRQPTEWLLFTSGTTGRPKIVVHSIESLIGPLEDGLKVAQGAVWSTFYDIRRYGGLTILFRALLGDSSMVLSHPEEPLQDFLARAGRAKVTHMTGTPSHWRRALMSAAISEIGPNYVRLSGEIADQAILNNLSNAFPRADVAHAFASTEAGFAFDVRDRLAGFPASLVESQHKGVELRVVNGSLRIRSGRMASRYLDASHQLQDSEGFVDTGDLLELRGDRYHFVGRREGTINVGGRKVSPEEVEGVINEHPFVQMVRARGRSSPITGAIVVADVVLKKTCPIPFPEISKEILAACQRVLPPHKVPAMLYEVPDLEIAHSGKIGRTRA